MSVDNHRLAELFRDLDGVRVEDVGDSCSGISGTYGWKAEKYETSMAIGEEMFEHMEDAAGETGMTECPTCAMQMEHGTGYEVRHPLELLAAALVVDARGDMSSGIFGEMMLTFFAGRGGQGVVIDGCIRDSAEIDEMEIGVLAPPVPASSG